MERKKLAIRDRGSGWCAEIQIWRSEKCEEGDTIHVGSSRWEVRTVEMPVLVEEAAAKRDWLAVRGTFTVVRLVMLQ